MTNKRLVFLIHGMGTHTKGWSKEFLDQLEKDAKDYDQLKSVKIRDAVNFKEIVYDNIFTGALNAWSDTAKSLIDGAPALEAEMIKKAIGWLTGLKSQENNFGWTHAADVLLWHISPFFRNSIKTEVANIIVKEVVSEIKASPFRLVNGSVISHSLGCSVAHDTLTDIASGAFRGQRTDFGLRPEFFHFESFHTFANVSRILERSGYPVYGGPVQPGQNGDAGSYCNHFYNYRNRYDPFTIARPFEPNWHVRSYHDKKCAHVYDKNTHSLAHYIRNPIVHIPLLRSILGDYDVIGGDEEVIAVDKFLDIGPAITEKAWERIDIRVDNAVGAMGSSTDVIDLMKGAALFF